MDFLKNIPEEFERERLKNIVLPGSNNNTSWLYAMERISINFGNKYNIKVNYNRYRILQIINICKNFYMEKKITKLEFKAFENYLNVNEKYIYCYPLLTIMRVLNFLPLKYKNQIERFIRPIFGQLFNNTDRKQYSNMNNILDAVNLVASKE